MDDTVNDTVNPSENSRRIRAMIDGMHEKIKWASEQGILKRFKFTDEEMQAAAKQFIEQRLEQLKNENDAN